MSVEPLVLLGLAPEGPSSWSLRAHRRLAGATHLVASTSLFERWSHALPAEAQREPLPAGSGPFEEALLEHWQAGVGRGERRLLLWSGPLSSSPAALEVVRQLLAHGAAVELVGQDAGDRVRHPWCRSLPLGDRRLLVTRPGEESGGALADRIERLGGLALAEPATELLDIPPDEASRAQLARLRGFHAVLFTSARAVDSFMARLKAEPSDLRVLHGLLLAAIGTGTAERLLHHGLRADVVAERARAEGLVDALETRLLPGMRVLLPRALAAREVVAESLASRGIALEVMPLYRADPVPPTRLSRWSPLLREGAIDAALFGSGMAVRSWCEALGAEAPKAFAAVQVACLGPVTAEAARQAGLRVDVVPEEARFEALVEALAASLGPRATPHPEPLPDWVPSAG